MSYKGARIAGALSQGASRWGDILMQLMARKDEQARYDAETAYRTSQDTAAATRYADQLKREDARDQMTAIGAGFKQARPMGELLMGVSMGGPLPAPVLDPEIAAPKVSVGGKEMAYMPPKSPGPLAKLKRGGVEVDGVPVGEVQNVLGTLPQDAAPEVPQMTPYQQAKIALDRDRLALDRDKLAREGQGQPDKATSQLDGNLETLRTLAQQNSPAGDVAFSYAFMKLLDPGSVVREGELKLLRDAAGLRTRMEGIANRAKTGQGLTQEQRADYLKQAEAIVAARKSAQGGSVAPPSGGRNSGAGAPGKSFDQRAAELKATGKSKEDVRAIMRSEGYYNQ